MPIPSEFNSQDLRMKLFVCSTFLLKLCAIFFLSIFLVPNISSASEERIHFNLASFNYPPFYFVSDNKIQGIAVDLTKEIFDRMKLEVSFNMYQLRRALDQLKKGKEDGLMILIKTPERAEYLLFTESITSVRGYLWCTDDKGCDQIENFDAETMQDYRIGVTKGYSYGVELDAIIKNMQEVEIVNTDLQNYKKLISNRIDIFPGNEIVSQYLLTQYPEIQNRIVRSKQHFMQWVLHMGISKKSPLASFLPEINKIIKELKEEDFINKIIKKHTQ